MSAAIDAALQYAEQSARDPVHGAQNADKLVTLLRRARAEGTSTRQLGALSAVREDRLSGILERLERIVSESSRTLSALGVTHIVRTEDLPALTRGRADSGPHRIEWPAGEGMVRSLYVGTLDGDPMNLARVSVRITRDNGTDDIFTTGQGAAYVPLVALHATNHNWFRLADFPLNSLQRWTALFRYEGADSGPPSVTPFLLFGFARR